VDVNGLLCGLDVGTTSAKAPLTTPEGVEAHPDAIATAAEDARADADDDPVGPVIDWHEHQAAAVGAGGTVGWHALADRWSVLGATQGGLILQRYRSAEATDAAASSHRAQEGPS
jgi:hypothetical protein